MKRISFLLSLCLVCIGLAAQGLPSGAADAGNSSKSTLAEGESTETSSWFIDRTGWTVTAQNETPLGLEGGTNGPDDAMLDGDDNTYWHSDWRAGAVTNLPLAFTIDLGSEKDIAGFAYLPRPNNGHGTCTRYKMYVHTAAQGAFTGVTTAFNSETGTGWGLTADEYASPVMQGSFEYTGSRTQKLAASDAIIRAQYILFVSEESSSGHHFTCAEFNLLDGTNKTLEEVKGYVASTNIGHYRNLLSSLVSFYGTQRDLTAAHDGLPGYFTQQSLETLKTSVDAANAELTQTVEGETTEETIDRINTAYNNLQSAWQGIRPNVSYPTNVYFTITNYAGPRGAIIYD